MTNKYWFDTKRILGWGWRPITWEGWVVTGLYVGAIALIVQTYGKYSSTFWFWLIGITILLIYICISKTRPK